MNLDSLPTRMGFVLAGGKSSRMGTDKAFLDFDGRTLLARALEVVGESCPKVLIVGDVAKFAAYGPVIQDVYPGCGPLGGIHTALAHSSSELNLMLAVDMPFVSSGLLGLLLSAAQETDAVVTVPQTSRGFQPLCAVYRRSFLEVAEEALRTGKYKIDALFAASNVRTISEQELSAAGFSDHTFANVNTPDDLLSARSGVIRP